MSEHAQEESTSLAGLAHGQLCYLQIPARDVAASARFYGRVFGWSVDPPGAGFEAPALIGEWTTERAPSADAGPLGWVMVRDVDRTLADAVAAGATVHQEPIPDGPRRLASFLDPAGNLMGIAQHDGPVAFRDNRTMPSDTVFPVLVYEDVTAAREWLAAAFGFTERWHADAHRAVLEFRDGAVMLGERGDEPAGAGGSVMVRVADADAHCDQARRAGATIIDGPKDFRYGERQYSAIDLGGHRWTFSQSIADRAPEEWGGTSGPLLR